MTVNHPGLSDPEKAEQIAGSHKREFWIKENQKHVPAHYRLQKCARIVRRIAGSRQCDLLDVGCGPATLMSVLPENVRYAGIDIAIRNPAPNLLESDILQAPIRFGDQKFDVVVAQGLFEYLGAHQSEKLGEIAGLLREHGKFVVTYTNFSHRARQIFEAFSNVQPPGDFRQDLARYFAVDRYFPASHNWHGGQPTRAAIKAANMRLNANIPLISPRLAVEYFFICSPRQRGR
jgi:SAM-dependent methyltransferase